MSSRRTSTCGQFLLMTAIALAGCAAPQMASATPTSLPPTATHQPTATATLSPPTPTSTPTPTLTLVPPTSATLMATRQMTDISPVRLFDEWPSNGFPSDAAQMTVIDLEDNILTMKVVYFGCREHTFELLAWTGFMLANPTQAMLHLSNDAHGDACTVQIAKFLQFDLTPLNQVYKGPRAQPFLLQLYEPIGGAFAAEPLKPLIEWP